MSVFEDFLNAKPEGGEEVSGVFWCKAVGCFDVVETATYYPRVKRTEWTCDEGHHNVEEENSV